MEQLVPAVIFKTHYMQANTNLIEPLLERCKDYGKTSLELIKLTTIDKTANILSTLISRLLIVIIGFISLITLNIAIALWLGYLMGKTYDGFLVVAGFYAIMGVIFYFMQPTIKTRINDSLIKLLTN